MLGTFAAVLPKPEIFNSAESVDREKGKIDDETEEKGWVADGQPDSCRFASHFCRAGDLHS